MKWLDVNTSLLFDGHSDNNKNKFGDDDDQKYWKVWDRCHYTGKYRGAAHSMCNLMYKTTKFLIFAQGI